VTFDDLPIWEHGVSQFQVRRICELLVDDVASHNVPAVGFVNEGLLYKYRQVEERTGFLAAWLDGGGELGNHTFSHLYLNDTPLAAFQKDVIRGEAVTSALMKTRGMRLRYFRHPFLCTGHDLETRTAFENFLGERGYEVAPVTIDSLEWLFGEVYARAAADRCRRDMRAVGEAYVTYMEEVFEFYERLSVAVLGYELPQILLLHANALNADCFDELVSMIKGRGYEFIPLAEALKDSAYSLPDNYFGRVGISWLQRWAITKGLGFRKEPAPPTFVLCRADARLSGTEYKIL
jgi:peptidoglycan/xylan/chitin deacetylase (PgdA/CDA1 family)